MTHGSSRGASAAARSARAVTWSCAPAVRSALSREATASQCARVAWVVAQRDGRRSAGCRVCRSTTSWLAARVSPLAVAFLNSWAASRRRPRFWAAWPRARRSPGSAWLAAAAQKVGGGTWLLRGGAAVLVEVVSQQVHRPGPMTGGGTGSVGGPGPDAGERPADAFGGRGGVGQGPHQPILAKRVPFGVSQVAGRRGFQESIGQGRTHAQAAAVHRRMNQRLCGGRGVAVEGQQFRHPGQELDDLPIPPPPLRPPEPSARPPTHATAATGSR